MTELTSHVLINAGLLLTVPCLDKDSELPDWFDIEDHLDVMWTQLFHWGSSCFYVPRVAIDET